MYTDNKDDNDEDGEKCLTEGKADFAKSNKKFWIFVHLYLFTVNGVCVSILFAFQLVHPISF